MERKIKNMTQEEKYKEIFIAPLRESACYLPKFGHNKTSGFSLTEFQNLYGNDIFYRWLGLDSPLMYSAHKLAGGITSIYRQIGIGCERLVREIFIDSLGLSSEDVKWSYAIEDASGKKRILSLDGRITFDAIRDQEKKKVFLQWKNSVLDYLKLSDSMSKIINGVVFEVRQGYKSKDSKRQNADIANATNSYINGYIPCLMVMSSQIDDTIVSRYSHSKWLILQGCVNGTPITSTYDFYKDVVGFDLATFMENNQADFKNEIYSVLKILSESQ
jgi:hypothetical protein